MLYDENYNSKTPKDKKGMNAEERVGGCPFGGRFAPRLTRWRKFDRLLDLGACGARGSSESQGIVEKSEVGGRRADACMSSFIL